MAPSRGDLSEDVHDLDAEDAGAAGSSPAAPLDGPVDAASEHRGPPAGRRGLPAWPDRTPAWVRSPLGALTAAVLASALVGVAGVQQVRAQAEAGRELDRALALVQVAGPYIGFDGSVVAEAGGTRQMEVQLSLLNGSERPVEVSVLGLSSEQVDLDLPAPVALDPGATQTVSASAEVDCATVPPRSDWSAGSAQGSWVDLAVVTDGDRHEERRVAQGDLTEQLFWMCFESYSSGSAWPTFTALEDGRQRVRVSNTGTRDARIGVEADPALGLSSDVELPATVPSGESLSVVLALSPDCRVADDGLGRQLDLVEVLGEPESGTTLVVSDPVVTAAWVAREVALACG